MSIPSSWIHVKLYQIDWGSIVLKSQCLSLILASDSLHRHISSRITNNNNNNNNLVACPFGGRRDRAQEQVVGVAGQIEKENSWLNSWKTSSARVIYNWAKSSVEIGTARGVESIGAKVLEATSDYLSAPSCCCCVCVQLPRSPVQFKSESISCHLLTLTIKLTHSLAHLQESKRATVGSLV